jgi:hypothetical protein
MVGVAKEDSELSGRYDEYSWGGAGAGFIFVLYCSVGCVDTYVLIHTHNDIGIEHDGSCIVAMAALPSHLTSSPRS